MNGLAFKLVASVLAVVMTATGCVCACPSMHAAGATRGSHVNATHGEQPHSDQDSGSDHGCCRTTQALLSSDHQPQPVMPDESDPCGHCDLKGDISGTLLDRPAASAHAGGHDLVASVALLPDNPLWDRPLLGAFRWNPDDVPRPPLLLDLFHTHCQLTA